MSVTEVFEFGECEVCTRVNGPGITICEYCETPVPRPLPKRTKISRGSTGAARSAPARQGAAPFNRDRPSSLPMVVALIALGVLVGVVSYFATSGGSNSPAAPQVTPSSVTTAPPPILGIALASMFDAGVDQCIDQLPYPSKLNAPNLHTLACDDPAARMRLLFITKVNDTRPCAGGGQGYYRQDDRWFCYQALIVHSFCYPAWIGTNPDGTTIANTVFYLPHACDETIDVTDEDLPPPDSWSGVTNLRRGDIRVTDASPKDRAPSCNGITFNVSSPIALTVCAEIAGQ